MQTSAPAVSSGSTVFEQFGIPARSQELPCQQSRHARPQLPARTNHGGYAVSRSLIDRYDPLAQSQRLMSCQAKVESLDLPMIGSGILEA
jgi:hypothetical protein